MNPSSSFIEPYWLRPSSEESQGSFILDVYSSERKNEVSEAVSAILLEYSVPAKLSTSHSELISLQYVLELSQGKAWELFQHLLKFAEHQRLDLALFPAPIKKKQILICDMDSTIVKSETLDDIAALARLGPKVKLITARAMRGELDFKQALQERVSLLTGLSEQLVHDVAKAVEFNQGAEKLISTAKRNGVRTVLVSGGFEPVVRTVAERLGFDRFICNSMEIESATISGKVRLPIVDADVKRNTLLQECKTMGVDPVEACAIGDGANDLPMLSAAGTGISFRGKPVLTTSIPYQINHTSLATVLPMMGIREQS